MSCETTGGEEMVGSYDLNIPQGSDTSINLTYKVSNAVVDLSTFTAKLQVRESYGTTVLLELTSSDSEIILGATSPNIVIKFPNAKTTAMTTYTGMRYDIEITSASSVVTRVLKGKFKLDREITV